MSTPSDSSSASALASSALAAFELAASALAALSAGSASTLAASPLAASALAVSTAAKRAELATSAGILPSMASSAYMKIVALKAGPPAALTAGAVEDDTDKALRASHEVVHCLIATMRAVLNDLESSLKTGW
jgi:hypothetical protein